MDVQTRRIEDDEFKRVDGGGITKGERPSLGTSHRPSFSLLFTGRPGRKTRRFFLAVVAIQSLNALRHHMRSTTNAMLIVARRSKIHAPMVTYVPAVEGNRPLSHLRW